MAATSAPTPDPKREDLDQQVVELYDTLQKLARRYVRGRPGLRVLDPTELVNESYLRLTSPGVAAPKRRTQFLALAATVLRSVLVDQAREQLSLKKGGHFHRVTLSGQALAPDREVDLLGLDEALTKLAALDPRQARVVELKFFGGLAIDEVAALLEVSPRTVDNDWKMARAWLHRELTRKS